MKKVIFLLLVFCLAISVPISALETIIVYEEEVLITGTKIPTPAIKSPWAATIVTKKDLELSGAQTVADALSGLAGIDIKSSGYLGSVSTVRIRGGKTESVLVLLNGQRINSPLLGQTDLSIFPVDNIEKIEIVRAPLSAVYGADASSGVINIITEKKQTEQPNVSVLVKAGTFATLNGLVAIAGRKNGLGYSIQISRQQSDGFRENSKFGLNSYVLNFDLAGFNLDLLRNIADRGVPGVPNTTNWSAATPNDTLTDDNTFSSLSYLKNINDLISLNANVFYNQLGQHDRRYNSFTSSFDEGDYQSWQVGGGIQANAKINDNFKMALGTELRDDMGQSSNIGRHKAGNTAYYFESQVGQAEPFSLNFGGRMDCHSVYGSHLSPRIGYLYYINPWLGFRAGAGKSFRAPTLNELYWNDPIWQMYGNSDLLPERSEEGELGLIFFVSKDEDLSFNYFTSTISNQIAWEYNAATFTTRAMNVNKAVIQGLELDYKKQRENFDVGLNATYQRAIQEESSTAANVGKNIPYTPELKGNIVFVSRPIKPVALFLKLRYIGKSFANSSNSIEIPSYSVLDFSFKRKFGKFTLVLAVDNVLDTDYYESVGFHPVTYAAKAYPMPGRTIFLGIEKNFGGGI